MTNRVYFPDEQRPIRDSLEAMDLSIVHWTRLAKGASRRMEAPYSNDCALCEMFAHGENPCENCPVAQHVRIPGCEDTPWSKAAAAYANCGKNSPEFRAAAQTMLDFLIEVRKARFNV